jgi:hypothetical protein
MIWRRSPGGARPASAARDGSARGGDGNRRTRRHHPLRQSPPAHGVSRPGSLRALQRRHTPPRRHHESREWRGPTNADRGGLELSVPGAHQPGATAAPGGAGKADPRHRVEGPGAVVSALSQARPGGKIDPFVFGPSKLDLMFGRTSLDAVRLPYAKLAKPGVAARAGGDDRHRSAHVPGTRRTEIGQDSALLAGLPAIPDW